MTLRLLGSTIKVLKGASKMTAAGGAGLTILLIDDNPKLIKLFTEALREMCDYKLVTAENGIEGLEKYFEVRPDCVVIDVKMPGLDGYQLARVLRGDPESAQTPLIILTAMAQEKDIFQGLASGADQYLTKPTTPLELLAAVERSFNVTGSDRRQFWQTLAEQPPSKPS